MSCAKPHIRLVFCVFIFHSRFIFFLFCIVNLIAGGRVDFAKEIPARVSSEHVNGSAQGAPGASCLTLSVVCDEL